MGAAAGNDRERNRLDVADDDRILRPVHKVGAAGDRQQNAEGDEFFDSLIKAVGYCDIRGVRGNRGAFVSNFELFQENGTEMWKSKILLSTSVFYNDYRVTTCFPFTDQECTSVLEDMYGKLVSQFNDVEFELTWEKMSEDENVYS